MFEVGKDVVLFTISGKSYTALVLAERDGEVSHLGRNGEPLLTLAYVKGQSVQPDYKKHSLAQSQALPEVLIEHDVVHVSHEFSKEFRKEKGITDGQINTHRGHGEWKQFESSTGYALSQLYDAQSEVERLKRLVADLTSSNNESKDEAPPAV